MSESLGRACDAIAEQIAAKAPDAEADDLVKLADAYSKLVFGPAGATIDNKTTTDNTNTTTTTNRHEDSKTGSTGFGSS